MKLCIWGEGHLAAATEGACVEAGIRPVGAEDCDTLWFCSNTPVGEDDRPDVARLMKELTRALDRAPGAELVLLSSQLPVGTCRLFERTWPKRRFAVQPENVRIATAARDFAHQERMIVGTRHVRDYAGIRWLLGHFTDRVLFMSPESAEMVKHTLNAFLALNIAFVNEIADVCAKTGANVDDVMAGFRSDPRVGNGPLRPGAGFNGGTLGRDVHVLRSLCAGPVVQAIKTSNDLHL